MALHDGWDAKAYKGDAALTSADASTGTWSELTFLKTVTVNDEMGDNDVTSRAGGGNREHRPGLRDVSVDLEFDYDSGTTLYDALEDAYQARTEIALAFMDGAIATSGSNGIAGNWKLYNWQRSEPIDGVITVTCTARPSSFMHDYTVGAS
jgi:hypothetical protein